MQAAKHGVATAKEKMQNMTAKAEEKMDKGKANMTGKTDQMLASDEAGREEAKAREKSREAEAKEIKHEKVGHNVAEKEGIKQDLDERKHAADTAYQTTST